MADQKAVPQETKCNKKEYEPLKLHDLLIDNINSYGNVQYNIPLRLSCNETRTGTSIGHRLIPDIYYSYDVKIDDPLPARVTGRDKAVNEETYKTTTGEYCVKPNPNKTMEKADSAMNCKNVIFMTGVEKNLLKKNIQNPALLSEMKDQFRGLPRPLTAPPDFEIKAPDPEYIFDIVASGRNEAPTIPETAGGYRRLLDPYLSTYRAKHRMWTPDEQYGIAAKDQINVYTDLNVPKAKGFGPKYREEWQPLLSKYHRGVYDRIHVKKEFKEVAANHNPVKWLKRAFQSETSKEYKHPFVRSELTVMDLGEDFFLAPYPPNPYQTNIVPFMYCSDYWHIAEGSPVNIVIDQINKVVPHIPCKTRYIVSRDEYI